MPAFGKCCKKNKDNEDFGLKADGSQYKTCVNCRERKRKKTEEKEDEITSCDVEIRNTFKQLNCKTVYLNDSKYMLNLDRDAARTVFNIIIAYTNFAITETIK